MLFRRSLVTFGSREVLLTSEEPVIDQFLTGRRAGPIGMSEEKDEATMSREAELGIVIDPGEQQHGLNPQLQPSPGLPPRAGAIRHRQRIEELWPTLSPDAQQQIRDMWAATAEPVGAVRMTIDDIFDPPAPPAAHAPATRTRRARTTPGRDPSRGRSSTAARRARSSRSAGRSRSPST